MTFGPPWGGGGGGGGVPHICSEDICISMYLSACMSYSRLINTFLEGSLCMPNYLS